MGIWKTTIKRLVTMSFYSLPVDDKLAQLGLTKAKLCRILGKHANTATRWSKEGAPAYVHAYLDLAYRVRVLEATVEHYEDRIASAA